jgi:hypothetical protein
MQTIADQLLSCYGRRRKNLIPGTINLLSFVALCLDFNALENTLLTNISTNSSMQDITRSLPTKPHTFYLVCLQVSALFS